MTILVTGGAGYIGSHTVLELARAGYDPVIVDNFDNSERFIVEQLRELTGKPIPCYDQNFADTAQLAQVLQKEHVDGVIHFAAFKAVGESVENPLKYYGNNVAGFVALLKLLVGSGVHDFVFSSTAAVYGNPPVEKVTEDMPCQPESPYGWSKYMNEIILHDTCAATPKLRGIALRYFNVVGSDSSAAIGELPKGKPQNLLPIVMQATAGIIPPLTVYGDDYPTPDGTCLRDYVHVVDLAKAHVAALQHLPKLPGTNYGVYNIGTGKPTSVLELIDAFETVNNVKVPYSIGSRRPGDPAAYYAIAAKAEQELGWRAEKTIEDACRDAWRWQSNNPGGYSA